MKYTLLLLLLLTIEGKGQWTDDFSDGNFTASQLWKGDSTKFLVNTQNQLQLNAPAIASSSYLSTVSTIGSKASWTFLIKMGFNPSSSNYSRIYVMSDQSDLNLPLNGYFVRVGGTNDDLCLFKQEGSTETLIADGRDKVFNTSVVNARIKVTRDSGNHWELLCDTTGGGNYILSASGDDGTMLASSCFGIKCIYTSTRSTNFAFDDFRVTGEIYTVPKPAVDSTHLYDVMINEIMADPTPVAGLPECEYLELYNRSGSLINLKDWKLTIGSNSFAFPDAKLPANGYLIITNKADTSKFKPFGLVLGLFTSSTTLTNTGQYIKLQNRDGRLIDWIEYNDSWYGDDFKAQGGWSLEQVDLFNPCGGKVNWKASVANSGGTPGTKNSVFGLNPDASIPDLLRVNVLNDSVVQLYFTEPLDSVEATNPSNYSINKDIGCPKKIVMADQSYSSLLLSLLNHLSQGETYNLTITRKLTDCVGNLVPHEIAAPLGLPLKPEGDDIVINEVLFNAEAGGADYIELYNRSAKMINARNLLIGTKVNDEVKNLCRLSEIGFLIGPSEYLLVSSNCENIKLFYAVQNEKCFYNMACMPSLDDKSGTIVLENDTFGRVDEFSYSETMHVPTLKNLEGISVERINPNKSAAFPGNWHSAAESAGYGTPGYRNSQYLTDSTSESAIKLSDNIFSPDNDGYKDVLQVSYKFNDAGGRVQVSIFDSSGRLVRRLMNNELLGTDGSFTWDGTSDAGKLCTVGMYVIFIRTVFDDGTVKEYKKSCVLALKR